MWTKKYWPLRKKTDRKTQSAQEFYHLPQTWTNPQKREDEEISPALVQISRQLPVFHSTLGDHRYPSFKIYELLAAIKLTYRFIVWLSELLDFFQPRVYFTLSPVLSF